MSTNAKLSYIIGFSLAAIALCCVIGFSSLILGSSHSIAQSTKTSPDYYVGDTYTVSFNANGGTGNMNDVDEVVGEYTLPSCGFTAPTGHQFDKWSVGGVNYSVGDKINVESDTTVYATWVLKKYSVFYNSNGGSGNMTSALVTYMNSHTIKNCEFSPPENKYFSGRWAINTPEGETKESGESIQVTDNLVLYALWNDTPVQTYDVHFSANGGTGEMDSINDVPGSLTLPPCGFVAPSGQQFKCWLVMGTEQPAGATVTIYTDTTISAVWEDIEPTQYTIFFVANGGTGNMNNASTTSHSYTVPECNFTPPNGKQFKCWLVNDVEKQVGDTISVFTSVALIACWEDLPPVVYTIKFNANGGTGTMNKVEMTAGTYTLPACTFTPPNGKEFKCWAIGNTKRNPGAVVDIEQNITITAIWQKTTAQTEEEPQQSGGLSPVIIILIVLGGAAVLGGGGFGIYKLIKHKKDTQYDWYYKDKK